MQEHPAPMQACAGAPGLVNGMDGSPSAPTPALVTAAGDKPRSASKSGSSARDGSPARSGPAPATRGPERESSRCPSLPAPPAIGEESPGEEGSAVPLSATTAGPARGKHGTRLPLFSRIHTPAADTRRGARHVELASNRLDWDVAPPAAGWPDNAAALAATSAPAAMTFCAITRSRSHLHSGTAAWSRRPAACVPVGDDPAGALRSLVSGLWATVTHTDMATAVWSQSEELPGGRKRTTLPCANTWCDRPDMSPRGALRSKCQSR
mmetsp:Transcript_16013/g.60541  ORF Transcript_16013/g.60541 Transcript_16013/m.60541 type:complete len:266 (+) Transcript_16013:506-1303(+)